MIKFLSKKTGITLIEVLIALIILALAVLPAVGTFSTYFSTATRQMEQEMALKIAESVVNLLQTLSFETFLHGSMDDCALDIQTPDGLVSGALKFTPVDVNMLTGLVRPRKCFVGESEPIKINRVDYKIEVEIYRCFVPQFINSPNEDDMIFAYFDTEETDKSKTIKTYDSFDDGYIFNVTVKYGKATPIKLSTFRTDMVK